jgi:hypothetical protein
VPQEEVMTAILRFKEEMSSKLDNLEKRMDTFGKKVQGLSTKGDMTKLSKGFDDVDSSARKAADGMKHAENKIDSLNRLSAQWITKVLFMGIGWGLIQQAINLTTGAIKDLIMASVDYEATQISIQTVAKATGRDIAEVYEIINRQADKFTDVAVVQEATLRLLSTSLSNVQIEKFISAIKDGSAAMGEQANVQLPLIASGFRRLNPNVLDNIGVNVRLDRIQRQLAQSLGVSTDALTNAQVEQALYTESMRQLSYFTGLYEQQTETAKGSIASISVEWDRFARAVSDSDIVKKGADLLAGFFGSLADNAEKTKKFKEDMEYLQSIGVIKTEFDIIPNDIFEKFTDFVSGMLKLQEITSSPIKLLQFGSDIFSDANAENAANLVEILQPFDKMFEGIKNQLIPLSEEEKELAENANKLSMEHITLAITEKTLKDSIEEKEKAIKLNNITIRQYRYELNSINKDLRMWNDILRDAEKTVTDLQNTIERKKMVLFPEEFETTEDKLKRIRSELESTKKTFESAFERFRDATSVREQQQAMEDAYQAHYDFMNLEEDEKSTTQKLIDEISSLNVQLNIAREYAGNAATQVAELTRRANEKTEAIEELSKQNDDWNEDLFYLREQLEDTTTKLKDVVIEIDILTKALNLIQDKSRINIVVDVAFSDNAKKLFGFLKGEGLIEIPFETKATGGFIDRDMIAKLHQGETIIPAGETREINDSRKFFENKININIGTINTSSSSDVNGFLGNIENKIMSVVSV